ncbi:hypothetical protein [Actinophytocola sp.]|uniref:hypothetical protein n=1 Tax=Actinophytocola sp. TaxID=1872138 RepID=UPI002D2F86B7|nr:hypothetical protein [Actinophytocola sp.]HYQ67112.1 hypothetical protein [Actinophytocola sp.]
MKIVVSAAGMTRLLTLCFVLGIVLGMYFGFAGGSPNVGPPVVDHSVGVDATAP